MGELTIKLDNLIYKLDAAYVHEALRLKDAQIIPMPIETKGLLGLLSLRGDVYPVLDRRKCIDCTREIRILLLEIGGMKVGFVVDKIIGNHVIQVSNQDGELDDENLVFLTFVPELLF